MWWMVGRSYVGGEKVLVWRLVMQERAADRGRVGGGVEARPILRVAGRDVIVPDEACTLPCLVQGQDVMLLWHGAER